MKHQVTLLTLRDEDKTQQLLNRLNLETMDDCFKVSACESKSVPRGLDVVMSSSKFISESDFLRNVIQTLAVHAMQPISSIANKIHLYQFR